MGGCCLGLQWQSLQSERSGWRGNGILNEAVIGGLSWFGMGPNLSIVEGQRRGRTRLASADFDRVRDGALSLFCLAVTFLHHALFLLVPVTLFLRLAFVV